MTMNLNVNLDFNNDINAVLLCKIFFDKEINMNAFISTVYERNVNIIYFTAYYFKDVILMIIITVTYTKKNSGSKVEPDSNYFNTCNIRWH